MSLYALLAAQLSIVEAQTRQPASLTVQPSLTPEPLSVLDNTGNWTLLGNINSTTHTFSDWLKVNLDPRTYLAKCDGSTDDTIPLQQWAAAIVDGSSAIVPGKCITKQPLIFPAVNHVVLAGYGMGVSQLIYQGTNKTVTPFEFGTANVSSGCSMKQWTIRDLSFESLTKMTAGYAAEFNEWCIGTMQNVSTGNQFAGNLNWFSGLHFNGGNTVNTINSYVFGLDPGTGIGGWGITVNGDNNYQFTDPTYMGITVVGFKIGINIAGSVGGFAIDNSDILENGTNVRVSQDVTSIGNNQLFFGPLTFLDLTYSGPEVDVVDPGGSQPFITFEGTWLASSFNHGLYVHAGSNWNILMNQGFVYNIGRGSTSVDGIHNESTTGKIWINGTRFGAIGGYCINSTVPNISVVVNNPLFPTSGNCNLGGFNQANVIPSYWTSQLTDAVQPNAGGFNVGGAIALRADNPNIEWRPIRLTHGTDQNNWDIFENGITSDLQFRALNDAYTSSFAYMSFVRGGSGYQGVNGSVNFGVPVNAPLITATGALKLQGGTSGAGNVLIQAAPTWTTIVGEQSPTGSVNCGIWVRAGQTTPGKMDSSSAGCAMVLGNPSFPFTSVDATIYQSGSSTGVSCSGVPTSSFQSVNGIVTHC